VTMVQDMLRWDTAVINSHVMWSQVSLVVQCLEPL